MNIFVTPTPSWGHYVLALVPFFFVFVFFLPCRNYFSTGPIGLKFETQILDKNPRKDFFLFVDWTPQSPDTADSEVDSEN